MPGTITLGTYAEVHDAFRNRDLRQALYDEGAVVMADSLIVLHGEGHRDRRRLENRLFRRETFLDWERHHLPGRITEAFGPFVRAGRGDLVTMAYRTTMNLTAFVAGIDRATGTDDETDGLYRAARKFSEGATLIHSTRDKETVRAEVRAELEDWDRELFAPSLRRRRELLARFDAGEIAEADLPADVLTTLLRNQDALELPDEVVRREVAFYLQAGSHSTANAFTHTVHALFTWGRDHPGDLARARDDLEFAQRCFHETLRLHPASPIAMRRPVTTTEVAGRHVDPDTVVVLDIGAANVDPTVFGPAAGEYDPHRSLPDGVPPWGHSFGGGTHACIGRELDGGMEPGDGASPAERVNGTITLMLSGLLASGGRPDPERPPVQDTTTQRTQFSSYPVVFAAIA